MEAKEIIDFILEKENITAAAFAKKVGVTTTQVYNIQKGIIKSISGKLANKIIVTYPHYSLLWLTTGEGSMLNDQEPVTHEIITPEPNQDVAPEIINDLRQRLAKLEQREEQLLQQLAEKDRQISQLLSIMSGSTSYEKESVAL